ncbi:type II CAAX prenyl endopeptidase Rce1 family protein [Streptomonospora algeriensis]|uniref:Type II CAAX prenyl endopeptidase Rce1 family protein n=1 Tax=Streptomonospora algeriensis TaxID=995084 RepID=A0ABW3BFT5_9ACTN
MTTPPSTTATATATTATSEQPVRGRRRLLPDPTPASTLPRPRPMPAWLAYTALVLAYAATFGYSLTGIVAAYRSGGTAPVTHPPTAANFWSQALPGWIQHAVLLLVVTAVVLLVAWRRRIRVRDLFAPAPPSIPTPESKRRARHQARTVFAWALAGMTAWMVASSVIGQLMPAGLTGGFAITDRSDAMWMVALLGPTQFTTAPIEETVVVAVLVILLSAAQRPAAEIYTVGVIAKVAYHAYYGPVVLLLIPEALLVLWLYRRTGRLWPVICAHAAYNGAYSLLVIAWPGVATYMG